MLMRGKYDEVMMAKYECKVNLKYVYCEEPVEWFLMNNDSSVEKGHRTQKEREQKKFT